MARKAVWLLIPTALGAVTASVWPDLMRYMKIKQMSYGNGHPENVPARGRASYLRPSGAAHEGRQGQSRRPTGGTTARDRTGVDPQETLDDQSPDPRPGAEGSGPGSAP